jgi:hypothetical protein
MDALTFGSALIEIAEALRAINYDLNPGYSLEVSIEALGPGSFRACLRTVKEPLRNLFSGATVVAVIVGVFTNYLYDTLKASDEIVVQVTSDMVIVQHGAQRIIVPKEIKVLTEKIKGNSTVARHVERAMDILENDRSVTSFGLTPKLSDESPLISFPRTFFGVIRDNVNHSPENGRRSMTVDAILSIHKAVFARSRRKWEFVWNGFKISAPILDEVFFDKLERREVSLRQGDAFSAKLRIEQLKEPLTGTWVNSQYDVLRVIDIFRKEDQLSAKF